MMRTTGMMRRSQMMQQDPLEIGKRWRRMMMKKKRSKMRHTACCSATSTRQSSAKG